jgi:CheY-like chemotaxis protein
MALFNPATGEATARLVYYGPGLAGKATNLRWIHEHLPAGAKGRLVTFTADVDPTLFFDFLPAELGIVGGLRARIQVYTVPGASVSDATQRMVLKRCDAVVFVADSQASRLEADLESLRSLRRNLLLNGVDPAIPQVIQYNKRDLPEALPVPELESRLNPGRLHHYEAVAVEGLGVEPTLLGVTRLLLDSLRALPGTAAAGTPAPRARREPEAAALVEKRTTTPAVPAPAGRSPAVPPVPDETLPPGHWLYLLDGARVGPVDLDRLVDLVLTSLPEDTLVWRPGLSSWVRANSVAEIAEEIPPPVPVPGAHSARGVADVPDFEAVPPALRTVLIADEDPSFRRYLALPLAAQGFVIHEAADGASAWQLALQSRPWMFLADISLPEVDGFELCRRVRRDPLLSRRPLLFISGSDDYKDRYRALQAGADEFLSKSTPIRELLIRIRLLMTRYSDLETAEPQGDGSAGHGFEGRIELFGAPALLQICGQGRLSGFLSARTEAGTETAEISLRDGEVVSASTGTKSGAEAVYAFIAWEKGRFRFAPGEPAGQALPLGLDQLLLEGCHRLDESDTSEGR